MLNLNPENNEREGAFGLFNLNIFESADADMTEGVDDDFMGIDIYSESVDGDVTAEGGDLDMEEDLMGMDITTEAHSHYDDVSPNKKQPNDNKQIGPQSRVPGNQPVDKKSVSPTGNPPSTDHDKPYDQKAMPVPGTGVIPNARPWLMSLDRLQRSFKESMEGYAMAISEMRSEMMEQFGGDELREAMVGDLMDDVIFEAFIEGRYFQENVSKSDKNEIRAATKRVIASLKRIDGDVNKYGLKPFPSVTSQAIAGAVGNAIGATLGMVLGNTLAPADSRLFSKKTIATTAGIGAGSGAAGAVAGNAIGKILVRNLREDKEFTTRLWQMVGTFNVTRGELKNALKHYTEIFSEELKDMVLNAVRLNIAGRSVFLLIVDSKKEKQPTITIPKTAFKEHVAIYEAYEIETWEEDGVEDHEDGSSNAAPVTESMFSLNGVIPGQ